MQTFEWPGDDGWPYPDSEDELDQVDPDGWFDEDAVALHATPPRLDQLEPIERRVIGALYGIDGQSPRTMKQLHHELNLPRADLRAALASGLTKLRIAFKD